MDKRSVLLKHLREAEHHVALGRKHISRQQQLIADLERKGFDSTEACRLLDILTELQQLHEEGRARLRNSLEDDALVSARSDIGFLLDPVLAKAIETTQFQKGNIQIFNADAGTLPSNASAGSIVSFSKHSSG